MAWENSKTGPSYDSLSSKPFDRIIIETSGVANPLAVLDILLNQRWLSTRISLKTVITTVSALMDQDHFDSFPEITAQIAWADTIVITQTDLASNEQIERLHARLDSLAPAAPRFQAVNGLIDVDSVFEAPMPFHRLDMHTAIEIPDHRFYSLDLRLEHPIPWEKLKATLLTLMTQHSGQLLRLKGVAYMPDDINPLLVQGVSGLLYPPVHLPARSSDDGIGHLIIISNGEIKNLAQDLISKLNELC
jgi:G3E family GTPase